MCRIPFYYLQTNKKKKSPYIIITHNYCSMNPFKFVFCVAFGTKLTEEQGTKSMQHIQFFFLLLLHDLQTNKYIYIYMCIYMG